MSGPIQRSIEQKLLATFQPARLEVVNESDMHKGPPGRESHFKVVIVSAAFDGLNAVKRHRAINKSLGAELDAGLHALSIHAWTLAQWEERGGLIPDSPLCGG